MTRFVIRVTEPDDLAEVRRLQNQLSTEISDPLGVMEGSHARSEFILLEVEEGRRRRAIGITSLMRAAPSPFVFETLFPDIWERIDFAALTGRAALERNALLEHDWNYIEPAYRGRGMGRLLTLAASMLLARHRGYFVCVGTANQATLDMYGGDFHCIGPSTELGGSVYRLGLLFPEQLAPRMRAMVGRAQARNSNLVWQVPGFAAEPDLFTAGERPASL